MKVRTTLGARVLLAVLGGLILGCSSSGEITSPSPCKCGAPQVGVVDLLKCLKDGESDQFEALERTRRALFKGLSKDTTSIVIRMQELRDQIDSLPLSSPLRYDKIRQFVRGKDDLLTREEWQAYLNSYTLTVEPMSARVRDAADRCRKAKRLLLVLFVNRPALDETLGTVSLEGAGFLESAHLTGSVLDLTHDVIALLKRPDD